MKLSTDRILTTHVGSLPRPDALAELLIARESGADIDRAAFDEQVSFTRYGHVLPEIAFEKLRVLAEGAALASRRLWPR